MRRNAACEEPFCRKAKSGKWNFVAKKGIPAHGKNQGDAMKVIPCEVCGRKVLVGNATKKVVCAICKVGIDKEIKEERKLKERELRSCANPECHNVFAPIVSWQKYCCHLCKIAMQRAEPRLITCKQCGTLFEGDGRRKYCSDECKDFARERSKRNKVVKEKDNEF